MGRQGGKWGGGKEGRRQNQLKPQKMPLNCAKGPRGHGRQSPCLSRLVNKTGDIWCVAESLAGDYSVVSSKALPNVRELCKKTNEMRLLLFTPIPPPPTPVSHPTFFLVLLQ